MRAARVVAVGAVLVVLALASSCSSGGSDGDGTAPRRAASTTTAPAAAECPDGSSVGRDSVIETHCGGTAGVQFTMGTDVVQLRGGDCVVDGAGLHVQAGALTDPKVPAAEKKDYLDLEVPAGGVGPTLVATSGGSSPTWGQVTVDVQPQNAGGTFDARTADGTATVSGTFSCG